ncbi:MAG: hypothetical protein Q4P66_07525 [Actinomycetaceae bacterium]|nr:hypothetical protein [Actinomycetaceae bacterium]
MKRSHTYRGPRLAFGIIVIALLVASCSTGHMSNDSANKGKPSSQAWSAEINDALTQARKDKHQLAISVLEDKVITDAEFESVVDDFKQCSQDLGLKEVGVNRSLRAGIYSSDTDKSEELTEDILQRCEHSSGLSYISFWSTAYVNPHNNDQVLLLSTCLERNGLLDQHYTSEQEEAYTQEAAKIPSSAEPIVNACFNDPSYSDK